MKDEMGQKGDLIAFETEDPKWTTIKLVNGVVLQVKLEVTGITFTGYNDNNSISIPTFNISSQIIVRTQHIPREFMKKTEDSQKNDNRSYR